ncbi:MAG TPA: hypothetical protein VMI52_04615 [Acetobacteraceae bacterium]|nr:hypothetical protein [Acetobacteraceae bacterium]
MNKITVITEAGKGIVAIGHGHLSEKSARKPGANGVQCGLRAGPNQRLHELEIPDDVSKLKSWDELEAKVRPHVKAHH